MLITTASDLAFAGLLPSYSWEIEQGRRMAGESKYQGVYPQLVTKIITSYVSHHSLSPEQIPELIASVHRTIDNLGKPVEPQAPLTPAVPVRRSVQRDAVICLDCGWKGKMLRRHLNTRHGLSAEQYLRRGEFGREPPPAPPGPFRQRPPPAPEPGLRRG